MLPLAKMSVPAAYMKSAPRQELTDLGVEILVQTDMANDRVWVCVSVDLVKLDGCKHHLLVTSTEYINTVVGRVIIFPPRISYCKDHD